MRVSSRRCYYRNYNNAASSSKVRGNLAVRKRRTHRWGRSVGAGALALTNSTRARKRRPHTCRGLTGHFHIWLWIGREQAARAAPRAEVDWLPTRALPAPTCPLPPTITNRMVLQNKTANKGRAANVRAADRLHARVAEPGDGDPVSVYLTPDSRGPQPRVPIIYEPKPIIKQASTVRLFHSLKEQSLRTR